MRKDERGARPFAGVHFQIHVAKYTDEGPRTGNWGLETGDWKLGTGNEKSSVASPEPTLLNAAVTVAAHGVDAALYEKYLARSRSASDPEEHYRYMYALASFSNPALVRRTMEYVLGPEVRNQDAKLLIARLIGNGDARALAWQLLREHWNDVQKKTSRLLLG